MKNKLSSKKTLVVPLILVFVFALFSVAGSVGNLAQLGQKRTSLARDDGRLCIAVDSNKLISSEFDLFTLSNPTAADNTILTLLYDRLLEVDASGNVQNAMADSRNWIDDMTYGITLREDISYHNGDPFTTADVYWLVNEMQSFPDSVAYSVVWNQVDYVNIIDDLTMVFYLKAANPGFFNDLALPAASMACRRDGDDIRSWGTGAFMIEEIRLHGATFERNFNWWGGYNGYNGYEPSEIVIEYISDEDVRFTAMASGIVDFAFGINSRDLSELADAGFTYNTFKKTHSLVFNMENEFFNDQRMRDAISCAIDYAQIAQYMGYSFNGPGRAWDQIFGNNSVFDPERAKALLEELGIAEGVILNLACDTSMIIPAQIIQHYMLQINVEVIITLFEEITPHIMQENNMDMLLVDYVNFSNGAIESMIHTEGHLNYGHYNNDTVDAILEIVRSGINFFINDIRQHLFDDIANINLGWKDHNMAYSVFLDDFTFSQDSFVDLRWAYFNYN